MKNVYLLLGGGKTDMRDRFSAIVNSIDRNGGIGANDLIVATGFKNETDFYKELYDEKKLRTQFIAVRSYDTESNALSLKSDLEGADRITVASGVKHLNRFKLCLADANIDTSNVEFISDGCSDVKYENILSIIYKFYVGRRLFQLIAYIRRIIME